MPVFQGCSIVYESGIAATPAADKKRQFISLRDEDFVGPDKAVDEELKRRQQAPVSVLAEVSLLEKPAPLTAPLPAPAANGSLIVSDARRWDILFPTKYNATAVQYQPEWEKIRILQFQQLLLQLALERIRDMNHIIRRQVDDQRYQIAYVFCKLKSWVNEMRQYYRSTQLTNSYRPVVKHLVYYQHMVRKNIDITYTVEIFYHINDRYLQRFMSTYNITPETLKILNKKTKSLG